MLVIINLSACKDAHLGLPKRFWLFYWTDIIMSSLHGVLNW